MNVLVIVNDQPFGSERPYNAPRLVTALIKRNGVELRVFLLGDAVMCAHAGQQLPEGHYHLDRMLKPLVRGGEVACGEDADFLSQPGRHRVFATPALQQPPASAHVARHE